MIHLFNGCTGAIGGFFDICGSALSGFFGLFGKTCDGCQHFCNQCCKECDIASILERPCCCYVCFSTAMLLPAIYMIVMALTGEGDGASQDDYIVLAFAVLHWLFGLYVQGRMGKALEELEEENTNKPQQQAMNANKREKGEAEESLEKMMAIILYDIPFALYFFFSFGTFIYVIFLSPNVGGARVLVLTFQILSLLFLIWWYMITSCCAACQCCAGYLVPKKKKKEAQGMPQGNTVIVQMQGVPQQQPMQMQGMQMQGQPMQQQPMMMQQPMMANPDQALAGAPPV